MMTVNRVINYITAQPFRPFRIKMASGEQLDIRHPEMIQIGMTTATIFTWMDLDIEEPKERQQEVSVVLIESIELLDVRTPQNSATN